jgi:hypothetical protein
MLHIGFHCTRLFTVVPYSPARSITLSVYASRHAALTGGSKHPASRQVLKGKRGDLYIAAPAGKSLPKHCSAGDVLLGHVRLCKTEGYVPDGEGDHVSYFRVADRLSLKYALATYTHLPTQAPPGGAHVLSHTRPSSS